MRTVKDSEAYEQCRNCPKEVVMMVQRGTGFCSQNCEDAFRASDGALDDESPIDDVPSIPERDTD